MPLLSRARAFMGPGPFIPIWIALGLLFTLSFVLAPGSVTITGIIGMLPFAAILAIAAIGQTLVVQQRGLDLTVASMMTVASIIVTKYPDGDDARLVPAIAIVVAVAVGAGLISGFAITRLAITPVGRGSSGCRAS